MYLTGKNYPWVAHDVDEYVYPHFQHISHPGCITWKRQIYSALYCCNLFSTIQLSDLFMTPTYFHLEYFSRVLSINFFVSIGSSRILPTRIQHQYQAIRISKLLGLIQYGRVQSNIMRVKISSICADLSWAAPRRRGIYLWAVNFFLQRDDVALKQLTCSANH